MNVSERSFNSVLEIKFVRQNKKPNTITVSSHYTLERTYVFT